jgi:hypothetical protein
MTDDVRRTQLAENMRFYADMRFKQLTLFLAGLTLAAGGVAQYGTHQLVRAITIQQAVAVAAALLTAVMWVMELRASIYWRVHREEVPDLWPRPKGDPFALLNATNSLLVLHLTIYSFWLWAGHWWGVSDWLIYPLVALGVLLLTFSATCSWIYRFRARPEGEPESAAQDGGIARASATQPAIFKRAVVLKYGKAMVAVAVNIGLAAILAHLAGRAVSRGIHLALLSVGAGLLLAAGIGRLGWAIQTIGGTSPPEVLDRRIFTALSHVGTFLVALDLFL